MRTLSPVVERQVGRSSRRVLAAVAAVLTLLGACGDGGDSAREPRETDEPEVAGGDGDFGESVGFCGPLAATVQAVWPEDLGGRSLDDVAILQDEFDVDVRDLEEICYYSRFDPLHRLTVMTDASDVTTLPSCDGVFEERSGYTVVSYCPITASVGTNLFVTVEGKQYVVQISDGDPKPQTREQLVGAADVFFGSGIGGPIAPSKTSDDGCLELREANRIFASQPPNAFDAGAVSDAYASAHGAAGGRFDSELDALTNFWREVDAANGSDPFDAMNDSSLESAMAASPYADASATLFDYLAQQC